MFIVWRKYFRFFFWEEAQDHDDYQDPLPFPLSLQSTDMAYINDSFCILVTEGQGSEFVVPNTVFGAFRAPRSCVTPRYCVVKFCDKVKSFVASSSQSKTVSEALQSSLSDVESFFISLQSSVNEVRHDLY